MVVAEPAADTRTVPLPSCTGLDDVPVRRGEERSNPSACVNPGDLVLHVFAVDGFHLAWSPGLAPEERMQLGDRLAAAADIRELRSGPHGLDA